VRICKVDGATTKPSELIQGVEGREVAAAIDGGARIGVAKGRFRAPTDIDDANDVIARLFDGELD